MVTRTIISLLSSPSTTALLLRVSDTLRLEFSQFVSCTVITSRVLRPQTAQLHVGGAGEHVCSQRDSALEFLCILCPPSLLSIRPSTQALVQGPVTPSACRSRGRCIQKPCRTPSLMPQASSAQPRPHQLHLGVHTRGPGTDVDGIPWTVPTSLLNPGTGDTLTYHHCPQEGDSPARVRAEGCAPRAAVEEGVWL